MTEDELYRYSLDFLEKRIQNDNHAEEDFLGFYHENCADTLALLFLEEKACQLHGVKMKDIVGVQNSPNFLPQIMHPDDVERCDRGLLNFAAKKDETTRHSYIQRLRLLHSDTYKIYFTCARLNLARNRFQCVTICLSDQFDFSQEARNLLDASEYIDQHIEIYTRLSSREREIISWVCAGKSVPEIAESLFLSQHTIEKHKKNIFSKGAFRSNSELIEFALHFNLV